MKVEYDAKYVLYLLTLFDKLLNFNDIMNMDLSLLNEMKAIQEKKLEAEAKRIEKINRSKQKQGRLHFVFCPVYFYLAYSVARVSLIRLTLI